MLLNVLEKPMLLNVLEKPMLLNVLEKPMLLNVLEKPMLLNVQQLIEFDTVNFIYNSSSTTQYTTEVLHRQGADFGINFQRMNRQPKT